MPYVYQCDGFCDPDEVKQGRPAITGEFNEQWFQSSSAGGQVAGANYDAGDLVTLCGPCVLQLLLES